MKLLLLTALLALSHGRWVLESNDERHRKADDIDELNSDFTRLREGCFKRPAGGCDCYIVRGVKRFRLDEDCFRDSYKAKTNYAKVVAQLKKKFKNLREGCYPMHKGCRCTVDENDRDLPPNADGNERVITYKPKDRNVHLCYTTGEVPDLDRRRRAW